MPHTSDFPQPYAYQFKPNRWSRAVLRLMGWKVHFYGFPTLQGIAVVYPHTSNWDAPIMFLAKSAIGVKVMFWAKDTLFRVPLLGIWLRWLGGVPVQRTSAAGVVGQVASLMAQHKHNNRYFWLGLAPEGTRKFIPGWRSGFYQTAVQAGVPLALVKLDYASKNISICDFVSLTGQVVVDMARIADVYKGVTGLLPANAAPVQLLDPNVSRGDTVVR